MKLFWLGFQAVARHILFAFIKYYCCKYDWSEQQIPLFFLPFKSVLFLFIIFHDHFITNIWFGGRLLLIISLLFFPFCHMGECFFFSLALAPLGNLLSEGSTKVDCFAFVVLIFPRLNSHSGKQIPRIQRAWFSKKRKIFQS